MKHLLLNGELLAELMGSLVFFEQAEWFVETLNDPNPQVPLKELQYHERTIADCLQKLNEAKSCSVNIYTSGKQQLMSLQQANPALRIVKFAFAVSHLNESRDIEWIVSRITELAEKIETGRLSVSSCLAATKSFRDLGYLETEEGKCFVDSMKAKVMRDPSDLDDFETIAQVVNVLPRQAFVESELDNIRDDYSDFAQQYAGNCDLEDPEELREEASRIENVGNLLGVNTEAAQASLHDAADRIEEEQEQNQDWEPDDEDRGGGVSDYCSDVELDSMFNTLNY